MKLSIILAACLLASCSAKSQAPKFGDIFSARPSYIDTVRCAVLIANFFPTTDYSMTITMRGYEVRENKYGMLDGPIPGQSPITLEGVIAYGYKAFHLCYLAPDKTELGPDIIVWDHVILEPKKH